MDNLNKKSFSNFFNHYNNNPLSIIAAVNFLKMIEDLPSISQLENYTPNLQKYMIKIIIL